VAKAKCYVFYLNHDLKVVAMEKRAMRKVS